MQENESSFLKLTEAEEQRLKEMTLEGVIERRKESGEYEEEPEWTDDDEKGWREFVLEGLDSNDQGRITYCLLQVGLHAIDPIWAESVLVNFHKTLPMSDRIKRELVMTCLIHVARVHNFLSPYVIEYVKGNCNDESLPGIAEDALESIEWHTVGYKQQLDTDTA